MYWIWYLIAVNIVCFTAFGIDKHRAKRQKWRIRESLLLFFCVLGGCIGAEAGMHLFHHKTQKNKFRYGVPAILLIQILLFSLGRYCFYGKLFL